MEDATFVDCDNAIVDPIVWIKGSARCDGVAAFSPTMRLLSCLAMPSASSISKWSTVWSSMQWIQWRSGPFKVFEALMKPAPVSRMHWLNCFEGRRCPASRRMWKYVIGVPWDCLLDIASDSLAPVRVSRKRERRGCFSFNVRHFSKLIACLSMILCFFSYNTTGLQPGCPLLGKMRFAVPCRFNRWVQCAVAKAICSDALKVHLANQDRGVTATAIQIGAHTKKICRGRSFC